MTTTDRRRNAAVAFTRFGLGPRAGKGIDLIVSDPIGALLEELDTPRRARIRNSALPNLAEACAVAHTTFQAENDLVQRELLARIEKQRTARIGFQERLVMFWSNHFNMNIAKNGAVRATIGQYERGVVRFHYLAKFERLLISTMRHPAMLAYLDQADSTGPNSQGGREGNRGLNFNLAREVLELHTVGIGAGYTEADVRGMARILSGWSYVRGWEARGGWNGGTAANHGQFIYRGYWHEPGRHRVLGKAYRPRGIRQGQEALKDLAKHPATAQFIAYKLVHHFLAETPTPDLVNPVRRAFQDSEGDLKETARAMVLLPNALTLPRTKLRHPYEIFIAQIRALGVPWHRDDYWRLIEALHALGNKPWMWTQPNGYPDINAHWETPDGVRVRADALGMTTWALHTRNPSLPPASRLANKMLGPLMSDTTRSEIGSAVNAREALTLLFLSPEFQRR